MHKALVKLQLFYNGVLCCTSINNEWTLSMWINPAGCLLSSTYIQNDFWSKLGKKFFLKDHFELGSSTGKFFQWKCPHNRNVGLINRIYTLVLVSVSGAVCCATVKEHIVLLERLLWSLLSLRVSRCEWILAQSQSSSYLNITIIPRAVRRTAEPVKM